MSATSESAEPREPKSAFAFLVGAKLSVERTATSVLIRQSHLRNNDQDDPATNRVLQLLAGVEAEIDDMIIGPLQQHPAWPWFSRINGIGNENIAKVIGPLNIRRANYPSSFWKYCGMHVVDVPFTVDQQRAELDKSADALQQRLEMLVKKYKTPEAEAEKVQVLTRATIVEVVEGMNQRLKGGLEFQSRGMAPTRQMYKATSTKLDYNSDLRVMCFRLAGALIKSGIRYFCATCNEQRPPKVGDVEPTCQCGSKEFNSKPTSKYAEFYLKAKDDEVRKLKSKGVLIVPTLELPKSDGKIFEPVGTIAANHVHMRAQRKMMKLFLAHLWMVWRTAEGLPLSTPYAHGILGHSPATMIDPWTMVDRPEPKRKKVRPIVAETPETPPAAAS